MCLNAISESFGGRAVRICLHLSHLLKEAPSPSASARSRTFVFQESSCAKLAAS